MTRILLLLFRRIWGALFPLSGDEERDGKQLRSLAVLFYLTGLTGIVLTCASVPNLIVLFVLTFGGLEQSGALAATPRDGLLLGAIVFLFCIFCVVLERLAFVTSQSISQRRRPEYIRLMLFCVCLVPPLGPLVCVYGFRVMGRESVKRLFYAPNPTLTQDPPSS